MATTLDMKSAKNVMPMKNFATAHGYKVVELVVKKTSSGKEVRRVRFDGTDEYKLSSKAVKLVSDGEYALTDLQYAEYHTVEDPNEWVCLFVPAGSKIVGENVLAKTTF